MSRRPSEPEPERIPDDLDLPSMSYEDLQALRERVMAAKGANNTVIASCAAQIEAAMARVQDGGDYADSKWFAAVNTRARYAGHEDQRLARLLGDIRRASAGKHQEQRAAQARAEGGDAVDLIFRALRLLEMAVAAIRTERGE